MDKINNIEQDNLVRGEIDMTVAIHSFLKPIYETYCKDKFKDLKTFVDEGFFGQGGEINVKFPKWMEWMLGMNQDPDIQQPDSFIQFTPEMFDDDDII